MRFLRNHANSNDSNGDREEGLALEMESADEKKHSLPGDTPPNGPRIVAAEDSHEESTEDSIETGRISEETEDKGTGLADGSAQTEDEGVLLVEGPHMREDEELWVKGLLGSPKRGLSEVPDASEGPEDVDIDIEVLSEESGGEDADVEAAPEEPEDESISTEPKIDGSEAYVAGTVSLYYLRGLLYHQRMNLDDAIRYLGECLEMAVETDLFDYVIKSQIQLAAVCLKRYRIHGNEKDYYSALHYSENLIQIAKEQELDELWTEALLLRAILRKIAQDVHGARDDLNQARAMAKSMGHESVELLIEHELQEVRRLVVHASKMKRIDKAEGSTMMDEAVEAIPAIFDVSLKLELSRETLTIPVELKRLVIMNLSSGLPLYSFSFEDQIDDKGELLYGFLSALSHIASEIMDRPGMIRSISHEGSTVMMEHRGAYMAALFASREDFRARQSLSRFLREFLRSLPEMHLGEVVTQEYRLASNELLRRIFRVHLEKRA